MRYGCVVNFFLKYDHAHLLAILSLQLTLQQFRVNELHILLSTFRCPKLGKKNELIQRFDVFALLFRGSCMLKLLRYVSATGCSKCQELNKVGEKMLPLMRLYHVKMTDLPGISRASLIQKLYLSYCEVALRMDLFIGIAISHYLMIILWACRKSSCFSNIFPRNQLWKGFVKFDMCGLHNFRGFTVSLQSFLVQLRILKDATRF